MKFASVPVPAVSATCAPDPVNPGTPGKKSPTKYAEVLKVPVVIPEQVESKSGKWGAAPLSSSVMVTLVTPPSPSQGSPKISKSWPVGLANKTWILLGPFEVKLLRVTTTF